MILNICTGIYFSIVCVWSSINWWTC